jgi:hypothetical protein
MAKATTMVWFSLDGTETPVLKVAESEDQVLIVIRFEPDEHLSLHREADGRVLLTHWSPDKPPSTWDAQRVEAARSLGYRDPERHAHYYAHWPLVRVQGMNGHELVARRITLANATAKAKYDLLPKIVLTAPAAEFMLSFHLSTDEQPYSPKDDPHVATELGDLYFQPGPTR